MCSQSLTNNKRAQVLRRIFDTIDKDKSGDVSKEEIVAWLSGETYWAGMTSTLEEPMHCSADKKEFFTADQRESVLKAVNESAGDFTQKQRTKLVLVTCREESWHQRV